MMIQVALVETDQAQPVCVVTAMVPLTGEPATISDVGDTVYEHVAFDASWLMVNVAPAIVSDPVRLLVVLFAPTLNDTGPLPVPEAPAVTVIQLLLLTAVQLHQSAAVTVLLPTPAPEENDWVVGEIVGAQGPP